MTSLIGCSFAALSIHDLRIVWVALDNLCDSLRCGTTSPAGEVERVQVICDAALAELRARPDVEKAQTPPWEEER